MAFILRIFADVGVARLLQCGCFTNISLGRCIVYLGPLLTHNFFVVSSII